MPVAYDGWSVVWHWRTAPPGDRRRGRRTLREAMHAALAPVDTAGMLAGAATDRPSAMAGIEWKMHPVRAPGRQEVAEATTRVDRAGEHTGDRLRVGMFSRGALGVKDPDKPRIPPPGNVIRATMPLSRRRCPRCLADTPASRTGPAGPWIPNAALTSCCRTRVRRYTPPRAPSVSFPYTAVSAVPEASRWQACRAARRWSSAGLAVARRSRTGARPASGWVSVPRCPSRRRWLAR